MSEVVIKQKRFTTARFDNHIHLAIIAARRREMWMQATFQVDRGECCPSCKYGESYRRAVAKQERALAWLAIMLRKRGHDGATGFDDVSLARAIEINAWP